MWSVSTSSSGRASRALRAASRSRSGRTWDSGSGTSERNGSSGPATRGRQEAGQEQVALLEAQELLVELEVGGPGEQAAGLELDERRGDEQELGRDLEIEGLRLLGDAVELGEVAVDDRRQRHVPELDLLLEDEVQQQVERTREDRRLDLVAHPRRGYRNAFRGP
jgi:hypothetical protein